MPLRLCALQPGLARRVGAACADQIDLPTGLQLDRLAGQRRRFAGADGAACTRLGTAISSSAECACACVARALAMRAWAWAMLGLAA